MGTLDLDKRREEYGEGHVVTLGGESYTLPPKFPVIVAQHLQAGRVDLAVGVLFGDDAIDVVAPMLNDDDINAILFELYGLDEPEGVAVTPSSNGRKPRPKARR